MLILDINNEHNSEMFAIYYSLIVTIASFSFFMAMFGNMMICFNTEKVSSDFFLFLYLTETMTFP